MDNAAIEHHTIKQVIVTYDAFLGGKDSHVCVTEWKNGEGYDVDLNETGSVHLLQLTHCQWYALKKAMKAIQKGNP